SGEQLDRGGLAGRRGDLSIEVLQHRHEVAAWMESPSAQRVARREGRIDVEGSIEVCLDFTVLAEGLVDDRGLEVRAGQPDTILAVREPADSGRQKVDEDKPVGGGRTFDPERWSRCLGALRASVDLGLRDRRLAKARRRWRRSRRTKRGDRSWRSTTHP